jgi:hypothetical protein
MANLVNIVINGHDASKPAFDQAIRNAHHLETSLRPVGKTFLEISRAGDTIGTIFGDKVSGLIGQAQGLGLAAEGAGRAFAKLGAARFAALGGIAAVLAVAAGAVVHYTDKFEKVAAAEEKVIATQDALNLAIIKSKDPMAALEEAETQRFRTEEEKIAQLEKEGAEVGILTKLNEKLNEVTLDGIIKQDAALSLKRDRFVEDLKTQKLLSTMFIGPTALEKKGGALGQSEITDKQSETRAHQDNLVRIHDEIKDEKDRNAAIELEDGRHLTKLTDLERQHHFAVVDFIREEAKERAKNWNTVLTAAGSVFGSLATITGTFGKKAFALTQALRYAEAVVNTAAGVARALAEYAWPYSIIVGVAVAAAGAAQIATIASSKPPQAHGGLDYVPANQTFLLEQGERVVQRNQNARLTDFLDNWSGGGGGSGGSEIYLDGIKLGRALKRMSENGQLQISARSIV